uniref:Cytochrome c oxidase subunit 3 n=1 Tax=Questa ersei TaxID=645998 RepID=C4NTU2_9ANNE|nr:cytochrome c oxidase subunit III [Questa ersei]
MLKAKFTPMMKSNKPALSIPSTWVPTTPYFLINPSPWPVAGSFSGLLVTTGLIQWFHTNNMALLFLGLTTMLLTMFQWSRDIIRESTLSGLHTKPLLNCIRFGMILFIMSEVMFFFAFFWAFFHSSLSPTPELGCSWPPTGILPINPFTVPLLNTAVLLASGATVTWAHHSLTEKTYTEAKIALTLTISLGIYFTFLQLGEYVEASFTIADSIYGTTFFVATGFHGLHVMIGTTFLAISLIRLILNHYSSDRHFGFEAAAWYWHFVDVVWIFLFISIYWWGS